MVHEQDGIHIPHKADRDCQRLKKDPAPWSQLKEARVAVKLEIMHTDHTTDNVTP